MSDECSGRSIWFWDESFRDVLTEVEHESVDREALVIHLRRDHNVAATGGVLTGVRELDATPEDQLRQVHRATHGRFEEATR